MKLNCYKVNCITNDGKIITIGVMTKDEETAKESAIKSLLEGRHLIVKVVSVTETEAI